MQIPKIMVAIVVSAGSLCGGQKPMFRFSRQQLFKTLAAIFCILGISWLALDFFVPSPPSKITIATAFKGSTFDYFGQRYRERLASAGVKVELRDTQPKKSLAKAASTRRRQRCCLSQDLRRLAH